MSTTPETLRTTETSETSETSEHDDRADAEDRGKLSISAKAIEKIAGRVALETPGIHGSSGGFLGIGAHDDEDSRPKVKVQLHGLTATIHVQAGVRYPMPLRATTERLREQIRTQVSARCGIDVRQVNIDINSLISDAETSGRRELQ